MMPKVRSHFLLSPSCLTDPEVLILKLVVTVGIGQRVDVIVKGLNTAGEFTMRSVLASCSDDYQPLATAIVYYSHKTLVSNSTAWPALNDSLANCGNVCSPPLPPSTSPFPTKQAHKH
jgi:hypothetical protein